MRKGGTKFVTCGLLIAVILAPASALLGAPQHAEAQAGGIIGCAALFGLGVGSIGVVAPILGLTVPVSDLPTETSSAASVQKECIDAIAYTIAKIAIQSISQSIINWINSGFEGGPAFVTDLDQFLFEIDVEVFEEFLGSDAIAFLCSPWQFDIRLALALAFIGAREIECSLGDVVENIEQFVDGDFHQGGWPGWFSLTQRNNPYDSYFELSASANARIAAARFRELTYLDFGRGFLSFELCTDRPANPSDPNASPGDVVSDCEITTPGAVIESQLENVLGSGIRQLELADEINEIIEALIAQLLNQVITGGLRAISF